MADIRNNNDENDQKLIRFPTLAERDLIRKKQAGLDAPPKKQPFFNFGRIPLFIKSMIIIMIAAHVFLRVIIAPVMLYTIIYTFGFVPGHFTGASGEFPVFSLISPITYAFIHGSWAHLMFNVISMFAMGTFFEREFGGRKTAIMFFACSLAGAITCFVFNPFSENPVIGASGGIAGLFGAVTILIYQRSRIGHIGGRFANKGPWPLIVFWIGFMVLSGLLSGDVLAWQAHVGGFLAGIGLLRFLQNTKRI
jgi:membrane associated rhomboid family serine protease